MPALSTTRPAYMTATRSTSRATTPRSWVTQTTAMPVSDLQAVDEPEDLLLDRDVERGRRLVGDEHAGRGRQRHRDHHALQHAAGELVRVGALHPGGVGQPDVAEHLERARAGALAVYAVGTERLPDLRADAHAAG